MARGALARRDCSETPGSLTPDVHAPAGLLEFRGGGGHHGDFVDVAAGRSPSLQEVLGPVPRAVARLPPVGDELARHLERVVVLQADLLAAEGAALALVLVLAAAAAARRAIVLRIIHRVLYAARAALHDGLLNRRRAYSTLRILQRGDVSLSPENNQFHRAERSPGRSISRPRRFVAAESSGGVQSGANA